MCSPDDDDMWPRLGGWMRRRMWMWNTKCWRHCVLQLSTYRVSQPATNLQAFDIYSTCPFLEAQQMIRCRLSSWGACGWEIKIESLVEDKSQCQVHINGLFNGGMAIDLCCVSFCPLAFLFIDQINL